LLSFLNERIVLTDTTIEGYGCLGTVTFSAPLASIQGLRPRLVGNGIRAYKLVTDRGSFVCSDAMIQFKVFERRITDIRSRRTIETEPN
jgi:hypothetical protein